LFGICIGRFGQVTVAIESLRLLNIVLIGEIMQKSVKSKKNDKELF